MVSAITGDAHKLIVTIIKKGHAHKIVRAAKRERAQGSTILFGTGHGIHENATFLGMHLEPEKEIVLTAVSEDLVVPVLRAIVADGKLDKPGMGIGFVIDIKRIAGMCRSGGSQSVDKKELESHMGKEIVYDLIVTIVNKGMSDVVVTASKKAGAEGGTILYGRGTGIHEQVKLFSLLIEPEKELVLTLIPQDKTENVLRTILEDADLDQPGKGIAFVLPVDRAVGISHVQKDEN